MHLNTDSPAEETPRNPCIRDFADLVTHHLPCAVVKLVPLDELARRAAEIVAEQPRFKEEAPLVVALEQYRRARYQGLQVADHRVNRFTLASQAYYNA